jgi:hypothetical protein
MTLDRLSLEPRKAEIGFDVDRMGFFPKSRDVRSSEAFMKTKILLAATLLVITSAQAQPSNIYSQNVVGHHSHVFPAGTLICAANPLTDGTNTLDSALANLPAKSTVQMWNGTGFTASIKGTSWAPNFSIPPGVGFFVNSKSAFTNTYVGSVIVPVGECVVYPLSTNGAVLVGSPIPYQGDLNSTNLNLALPAKSVAQVWNGSGYTPSIRGTTWSPALPINVGQGFFLSSKSAFNWYQCLPAQ